MIVLALILVLLAILGAPLFAVIATSAMLGFQRDDTVRFKRNHRLISQEQLVLADRFLQITFEPAAKDRLVSKVAGIEPELATTAILGSI